MYSLQVESCFDAAHFLQGHPGACRNLHGHRWRVLAEITAPELQPRGDGRDMLRDFAELKAELKELTAAFDHKFIFEQGSLRPGTLAALAEEGFALAEVPFRPTAERLAHWFYMQLRQRGLQPNRVWVYETPENCASYSE